MLNDGAAWIAGKLIFPMYIKWSHLYTCSYMVTLDRTYVVTFFKAKYSPGLTKGDTFLNLNDIVVKCSAAGDIIDV